MYRLLLMLCMATLMCACRPEVQTPKPRGYARIELPKKSYKQFSVPGFPYSFEYPEYGQVVRDTLFFGKKPENPYWLNIVFPSLGGQIYISYKNITGGQPLEKLIEDSHEMSFTAHSKRADYIGQTKFSFDGNVHGILFEVGGNAASAYQFIVTDSTHHFMRGALYFDVTPNADSLKPVNEFLRQDIEHMLESIKWNN